MALDFNLIKIGGGFTELLSFQLQVPHGSIVLSVKVALLRKKPLKESVTIIKHVI